MSYLITGSLSDRSHHRITPRSVLTQQTQCQHNAFCRYHPGFCRWSQYWCLLDNKSICNAFINGKYTSNIRDDPNGKYLHVNCNTGVTYTNNIGDLPGYSNPIWYNPKGIDNILSLGFVQKHHLLTYNSQYGNKFVIHIPQRPTFKMTKDGIFFHDMRHLLKIKKRTRAIS